MHRSLTRGITRSVAPGVPWRHPSSTSVRARQASLTGPRRGPRGPCPTGIPASRYDPTPVAIHTEIGTRCAVCRRNLLVGESARTYQDARNRSVLTVCPLCVAKAERAGWQLLGERAARRPLPVNVDNVVDHERLVVRLQTDLEGLEPALGGSQLELGDERASREQLGRERGELGEQLGGARRAAGTVDQRLAEKDRLIADAERRAAE